MQASHSGAMSAPKSTEKQLWNPCCHWVVQMTKKSPTWIQSWSQGGYVLQERDIKSLVHELELVEVFPLSAPHTYPGTYQNFMGSRMPDSIVIPRMDKTLHPLLQKIIGKSKKPTSQRFLIKKVDVSPKIQRPK